MTIVLDRKLFKGNAQLVCDGATPVQMLEAANANFRVTPVAAEFGGRQFPQHQLWMREDNGVIGDCLGCFGTRRVPQQPAVITQFFSDFCAHSEKRIKPDVIGSVNGGKSIYMACRLAGDTSDLHDQNTAGDGGGMGISRANDERFIAKEDRTEHYLMLVVHYGESLATKAFVLANELVCSNGMALKTVENTIALHHRALQDGLQVEAILNQAIRSSEVYARMKNRFMHQPLAIADGINLIRQFHDDPQGESNVVKSLERIYKYNLIGGELETRKDNFWRLANAQTQYTSHSYVSKQDPGKTLLSQCQGSKARGNRDFMAFLESQFTTELSSQMVLA